MRAILFTCFLFGAWSASAQYYYKDVVGARESSNLIRALMKSKVSTVTLSSFDASNQQDNDFGVQQRFDPSARSLTTETRSQSSGSSHLVSYADANGNIIRTVDSSDMVVSTTEYRYDAAGQLSAVISSSADSGHTADENEQHLWEWKDGKLVRMLRIKNGRDTSFVNFKLDEKGNLAEETETHRGVTAQPVYYYYNDNGLITDIVRFSKRAGRLLPEYMFEYNDAGQVSQKITVPENSSNYLVWRYVYNAKGLKSRELIYNKQKKLTGKIEYQYTF